MKTYLYFVRHAISPFVFGNERDRGLSDQGFSDSQRVKELLINEGIDAVISSPYARAIQTVNYLSEALGKEIIVYEELRERPIKSLDEKCTEEELLAAIEKSFSDKDYCLHGGESTGAAQQRAIPVINRILTEHQGKKVVIGTHGNIMTIILNYFNDGFGYEFWKSTSKPDIYKAEFEGNALINVVRLWEME
ncbi:histidine phosphatase family protein [Paenibacillus alkalitolerans]|uniref:histidine phosphatase family protein n=1 Tax=Paenibacillus alkalitolerans TaxID=2799335 RepID=UPI0018F721DE|nr:histidine phosphatase family protein [Paenibacillus alkalitolerans]